MKYELTLKLRLHSPYGQARVAKQLESLFEFGTIKESIVDGLRLRNDPQLLGIWVQRKSAGDNR